MRGHLILRYMGMIVLLNAAFMFASVIIALINHSDTGLYPLLLSGIITATLGVVPLIFVDGGDHINNKEGYMIVVGSWLVSCLVGTFPYLLWGGEFNFITSWFESTSGFTTTGATILNDIEALPRSLLFWRSSTHWLGGIGVVMFVLVILPSLGKSKMTLSSVEISTMAKDNYKYRSQKIAQIVLSVYFGITVLETIALKIAGMTWFDALNHSFSTVATGGFSTRNLSIGAYDNPWIEGVITFFMAVSGLHFGLIFATLTGSKNNIFRSEVSRFYLLTMLGGSVIIAVSLFTAGLYPDMGASFRYSLFQVVSITTTTGFATANTTLWTPLAIILLTYLMFQCACAGSTSGGIKTDRILLAAKAFKMRILQQQHPHAIIRVKLNGVTQDKEWVNFAMLFIVAYIFIVILGTMVAAVCGVDIATGFSLSLSCMSNIGPGFGEVIGSYDNFSELPGFLKIFSTLLMLMGRLEIFGFLQLFMMKWWK